MSETFVIKGRSAVDGTASGEALVVKHLISAKGAIDERTGVFLDPRETDTYGKSIKGKILVFEGAKGASGWSMAFHDMRINGVAPAAMLFNVTNTKVALGAVVARTPAVTDFEGGLDITAVIQEGDWVKVDGTNGIVTVTRKAEK